MPAFRDHGLVKKDHGLKKDHVLEKGSGGGSCSVLHVGAGEGLFRGGRQRGGTSSAVTASRMTRPMATARPRQDETRGAWQDQEIKDVSTIDDLYINASHHTS
jgi:hypothetical protein